MGEGLLLPSVLPARTPQPIRARQCHRPEDARHVKACVERCARLCRQRRYVSRAPHPEHDRSSPVCPTLSISSTLAGPPRLLKSSTASSLSAGFFRSVTSRNGTPRRSRNVRMIPTWWCIPEYTMARSATSGRYPAPSDTGSLWITPAATSELRRCLWGAKEDSRGGKRELWG